MPRSVSNAFLNALGSTQLRPALFVQATFASGPLYAWTGVGSIDWNNRTWQGVGSLGSVSTIEEAAVVEAKGITLKMSGIDPQLLSTVLGEFQVGLPVTIWLGLFDTNGQLIPDPMVSFAGRMDQPTVEIGGDDATISIACENRLLDMNNPVDRRYTNEDQQLDHPGDRGFEFVNSIQDVSIFWGCTPSSTNNR